VKDIIESNWPRQGRSWLCLEQACCWTLFSILQLPNIGSTAGRLHSIRDCHKSNTYNRRRRATNCTKDIDTYVGLRPFTHSSSY